MIPMPLSMDPMKENSHSRNWRHNFVYMLNFNMVLVSAHSVRFLVNYAILVLCKSLRIVCSQFGFGPELVLHNHIICSASSIVYKYGTHAQ